MTPNTITDRYRELNRQLHETRADYGRRGKRHADVVRNLCVNYLAKSVLDYGCGKATLAQELQNMVRVQNYDPCIPEHAAPPRPADIVVCTDVLEHIEPDCLAAVLGELAAMARKAAFLVIATEPDGGKTLPDGRDPHLIVRPAEWWQKALALHFGDVQLVAVGKRDATFVCKNRLTVVTWKWGNLYKNEHVTSLYEQVAKHYRKPFRFVVMTDDMKGEGLHPFIERRPVPTEHAHVPNPSGQKRPRCYRRLWAFSHDARELFGPRMVSLDLDMLILNDVTELWERPEPFVIWRDPSPRQPYNGGMWLLQTNELSRVWTEFDPKRSPTMTQRAGFAGSDQAWLAYCLGPNVPTWDHKDGVYSYQADLLKQGVNAPPKGTRILMFHGKIKPWDIDCTTFAC